MTKQTIAIIGASGAAGSMIAKCLAGGNRRLLLFDKETDHLKSLGDEIYQRTSNPDIELIDCEHSASWESDIIILSVPEHDLKQVVRKINEVATQKIVVYLCNQDNGTKKSNKSAEELQQLMPHSKVVAVLNFNAPGKSVTSAIRNRSEKVILAGSYEEALKTAHQLLTKAGFNPVITRNPKVEI